MTLQTPQIIGISAFDPSFSYDLKFIYDDRQAVKNRLVISDNNTGNVVYDKTQNAMKLLHTIPQKTLTAGKSYVAQVQVFDVDGNSSNLSEKVLFYCYSTPSFYLSGISQDKIIDKAVLSVKLNYSQKESETLRDYQFFLYNSDKSICSQSEVYYSSPLLYTFYNLGNETSYYVRAIGHTSHGMYVDTGMILFHVKYVSIPANIIFEVKNHSNNGYVSLFSGIIDIGYDISNNNYIIQDGLLKLWNNKLTYNKGFTITSDFILQLEAMLLPLNKPFLLLNNKITLTIKEICNKFYCCIDGIGISQCIELPHARLVDDKDNYITTSNGDVLQIVNTNYEDNDLVVYEIKRINGIYGLSVYYKSDVYGKYEEEIS